MYIKRVEVMKYHETVIRLAVDVSEMQGLFLYPLKQQILHFILVGLGNRKLLEVKALSSCFETIYNFQSL